MPLNQHMRLNELRDKGFHIIDGDLAGVGSSDGQITITAFPRTKKTAQHTGCSKSGYRNHSQMRAMAYPGDMAASERPLSSINEDDNGNTQALQKPEVPTR